MAERRLRYIKGFDLRWPIISELYKRGYTLRAIREEVMARLNLPTYSLQTVHKDIKRMLAEWRKERIANLDEAVSLELKRLDDIIREAWAAWDKSKQDGERKTRRQIGVPNPEAQVTADGQPSIITVKLENAASDVVNCGDPRYLDIIHKALIERRKLLGLYAPEKKDISAEMSFSQLLIESGVIDNEKHP